MKVVICNSDTDRVRPLWQKHRVNTKSEGSMCNGSFWSAHQDTFLHPECHHTWNLEHVIGLSHPGHDIFKSYMKASGLLKFREKVSPLIEKVTSFLQNIQFNYSSSDWDDKKARHKYAHIRRACDMLRKVKETNGVSWARAFDGHNLNPHLHNCSTPANSSRSRYLTSC